MAWKINSEEDKFCWTRLCFSIQPASLRPDCWELTLELSQSHSGRMLDQALLLCLTRVPELIFNFAFSFTSLPSTSLVFLPSLSLPFFLKNPLGWRLSTCGNKFQRLRAACQVSVKHAVMYTTCNYFCCCCSSCLQEPPSNCMVLGSSSLLPFCFGKVVF